MEVIINHFDKYPLITKKLNDYNLFKLAYNLIIKKEQLSIKGIEKLVSIKISMNLGLSSELKATFPQINSYAEDHETIPAQHPEAEEPRQTLLTKGLDYPLVQVGSRGDKGDICGRTHCQQGVALPSLKGRGKPILY